MPPDPAEVRKRQEQQAELDPHSFVSVRRDHPELVRGRHPGDRYMRRSRQPAVPAAEPEYQVISGEAPITDRDGVRGVLSSLKQGLIGRPLASREETGERVGKLTGLALFASDNISSSAYATEEIMRILILAGIGVLALTLPITVGICMVLAIVVLSYLQVIRAYPNGGGSYVVANENLGPLAGLTAGAALLTDYILTVSVSTAAGVAAITSAFPELYARRVPIMIAVVGFMT